MSKPSRSPQPPPRLRAPAFETTLPGLHQRLCQAGPWSPPVAGEVLLALLGLSVGTERVRPWFDRLASSGDPHVFEEARTEGLGRLFDLNKELDQCPAAGLRSALQSVALAIAAGLREASPRGAPSPLPALLAMGMAHEHLLTLPTGDAARGADDASLTRRKRWGSHYTPWALAEEVVARALLHPGLPKAPRVCDPAMGGGVFLLATAIALAARQQTTIVAVAPLLHGIDRDARAVAVARYALHALAGSPPESVDDFSKRLVQSDALLSPAFDGDWRVDGAPTNPASGFDLIVGNPPFIGGKRIATHLGRPYAAELRAAFPGVSGNADLCALFLRRAYENLSPQGAAALITTSAIAKGATREHGLGAICRAGATVVEADREQPWPGDAAVHIALLHFIKGVSHRERRLDGLVVPHISAFLEASEGFTGEGGHAAPPRQPRNAGLAFVGCYLRGMGFTFDDGNPDAIPLAVRETLVSAQPHLATRLRPYLGGEEVARHPEQAAHRFALDLNDLTLADEPRFPELFALARRFTKPARDRLPEDTAVNRGHRARFFAWANARPELQRAVRGLPRMLVTPRIATHRFFAFLPTDVIPSEQLIVFALASDGAFAALSSIVHEVWARAFGSTQGVGLRYTPSDVFETFPLQDRERLFERLAPIGKVLYEQRQTFLRTHQIGLSELYARLDDLPDLGRLHRELDEQALSAFGLPGGIARELRRGPGSDRSEAGRRVVAHLRSLTER